MPLIDHLRELRRRLLISAVAIGVALVPAWIYYDSVFAFLRYPFDQVLKSSGGTTQLTLPGVIDPFTLQIQVTSVAAVVLASPVWLAQLWGFVTPGLHRRERRWTSAFVVVATPLVLAGCYLAYQAMPVGLNLLLGFTPDNVVNLITVDKYFDFVFRTMAAFAIGFLAPLVLVMMNAAELISAKDIRSHWRGATMVVMLFAAIATPTGDPINMMLVGVPMMLLVFVAWLVAALNDWRRQKRA